MAAVEVARRVTAATMAGRERARTLDRQKRPQRWRPPAAQNCAAGQPQRWVGA